MRTYIEKAEKKAGTQIELAKILNVSDAYIRNAKKGRSGLPDAVCIKLADYIEADRLEVIAASNLVTEKDAERRKIFESCIANTSRAACVALTLGIISNMTPIHNSMNNMEINRPVLQEYKLLAIERKKKIR